PVAIAARSSRGAPGGLGQGAELTPVRPVGLAPCWIFSPHFDRCNGPWARFGEQDPAHCDCRVPCPPHRHLSAARVRPAEGGAGSPGACCGSRMPARRRSRTTRRPRKRGSDPASVKVGVRVNLTRAQIQRLKDRAAADLRSLAKYVTWLVAQNL